MASCNRKTVLFLIAMGSVEDRITCLNRRADDYLVKPFVFGELSARIDALARSSGTPAQDAVLRLRDLSIDIVGG